MVYEAVITTARAATTWVTMASVLTGIPLPASAAAVAESVRSVAGFVQTAYCCLHLVYAVTSGGSAVTTVLFVHGTGVREPGFSETLERVQQGFRSLRPEIRINSCYWGGSAGSVLHSNGVSVPGYATGRDVPGVRAVDERDGDLDAD